MASVTLAVSKELKADMEHFSWVNWSAIAKEEALKKGIFERFIKTGKLSSADKKFCEKIDWHPVDELPLKEEFVKELAKTEKGSHHKMKLEELDKLMRLK